MRWAFSLLAMRRTNERRGGRQSPSIQKWNEAPYHTYLDHKSWYFKMMISDRISSQCRTKFLGAWCLWIPMIQNLIFRILNFFIVSGRTAKMNNNSGKISGKNFKNWNFDISRTSKFAWFYYYCYLFRLFFLIK